MLFKHNCQNFASYLVQAISPGALLPHTIQDFLKTWFDPPMQSAIQFPGTFPESPTTSGDSGSYFTAVENISFDTTISSTEEHASALTCKVALEVPGSALSHSGISNIHQTSSDESSYRPSSYVSRQATYQGQYNKLFVHCDEGFRCNVYIGDPPQGDWSSSLIQLTL